MDALCVCVCVFEGPREACECAHVQEKNGYLGQEVMLACMWFAGVGQDSFLFLPI